MNVPDLRTTVRRSNHAAIVDLPFWLVLTNPTPPSDAGDAGRIQGKGRIRRNSGRVARL